jgi:uncharacterized membrane protein
MNTNQIMGYLTTLFLCSLYFGPIAWILYLVIRRIVAWMRRTEREKQFNRLQSGSLFESREDRNERFLLIERWIMRDARGRSLAFLRAEKTLGPLENQPIFSLDNYQMIVERAGNEQAHRLNLYAIGGSLILQGYPLLASGYYLAVLEQASDEIRARLRVESERFTPVIAAGIRGQP